MKTDRRGFIASLLAAPLAAKMLIQSEPSYDPYLHSPTFSVPSEGLTEAKLIRVFEQMSGPFIRKESLMP